ncbi:MAG TPA: indole-3-glycerol phosphate synthase TrpC [Candidatus Binatia bacterium]|nr:indole-3-glycerol phosphate synthase TrpC [Candidatus Binatia bacterium]
MAEILTAIADHVRGVVERRRRESPLDALRERPLFDVPTRGFARSLEGKQRRIVAEVKKASPSKGLIRPDFDPLAIAADYAASGASAISVLTEERFFQGSLRHLEEIHGAVTVPLLRKDFTLDSYQIVEAKSYGADAVLLIAAMLDSGLMRDLRAQAGALGLDAIIEVHTESELSAALEAGAQVIGINNRDLKTFSVDLSTTERLAPLLPRGTPAVCESGIDSPEQIQRIEKCGIHAFLIGEALMRAPEPGKQLAKLLKG